MQDLTVIGIENGALLVASEAGERFRVAIDDVLQSRLRQSTSTPQAGVKVSPREIQAQIRAGMSAEDVARSTGATLEYVQRFEGPVVAERLHIVSSALRVPVKVASHDPLGDDQPSTFGETIEERLEALGASDLRWASWKEETGWIVKLTFTATDVDHDARWQYDPKRHSLTPVNSGAVTLSQQGEIVGGLIPRLRAVGGVAPGATATVEKQRTVSPGLEIDELDAALEPEHDSPAATAVHTPFSRTSQESSAAASEAAVKRAEPEASTHNETADLLEALRRRRGEREAASFVDVDGSDRSGAGSNRADQSVGSSPFGSGNHPANSAGRAGQAIAFQRGSEPRPLAHLGSSSPDESTGEIPLDGFDEISPQPVTSQPTSPAGADRSRVPDAMAGPGQRMTGPQSRTKGARRTAMPSWDEIVFGARSDDDLS